MDGNRIFKPKILVPSGTGDIFWIMVKMESFIEKELNGINPIIFTNEDQSYKPERSAAFIKRIPFVEYGGAYQSGSLPSNLWMGTEWLKSNYNGFDYLFCVNGILRSGYSLEDFGLNKYKSNWFFKLNPSTIEEEYIKIYKKKYGNYIVGFFSDDGMFKVWLKNMPLEKIYSFLEKLYEKTKCKILLTGKEWDSKFNLKIMKFDKKNILIDLTGQTDLNQLFALIKSSKAVVGWCGGNTIMATVFKKPTFIFWSKYFKNSNFFINTIPPLARKNWYDYTVIENLSPIEQLVGKIEKIIK